MNALALEGKKQQIISTKTDIY